MNVLLPQTTSAGAAAAAADLVAHGHQVVVCHPEGQEECIALSGGRCPLDTAAVDAAVVVRPFATSEVLPLEAGVRCAAQRGLPLVVAGEPAGNPFAAWASAEEEGSDVAATVETVVASALPHLSAIATGTLRAAIAVRSIDEGEARAEVRRRHGGLIAELIHVDQLDRAGVAAAGVRVAGALRATDPWVGSIDVTVRRA